MFDQVVDPVYILVRISTDKVPLLFHRLWPVDGLARFGIISAAPHLGPSALSLLSPLSLLRAAGQRPRRPLNR